MRFMQLTDTHIREEYSADGIDALLGQRLSPAENLKNLLKRADWKDIDFMVITGDLVHEGITEDYLYLNQIIKENVPEQMKVLYVLGNHDHKEAFYCGIFEQEKAEAYYYTSTVQGYRLIVLDSAIPGKESGTVSKEQLDWLKQTLSEPSEKGSIVFLHHPVFWNTGGMSMELTNGGEVLEALAGSDVFAIFCGHTHANAVQQRDGITQYTADSMAFSIEVHKGILSFTDKAGYLIADVKENTAQVHFETVREDRPVIEFPADVFARQLASMDE